MSYENTHTFDEIKATVENGFMLYDNYSNEQLDYLISKNLVYQHELEDRVQSFIEGISENKKKLVCLRLDYFLTKQIKEYVSSCVNKRIDSEIRSYSMILNNRLEVFALNSDEKNELLTKEKSNIFSYFNALDFATNSTTELIESYLSELIEFEDIMAFVNDDKQAKLQFWSRLSKLDWVKDELECSLMKAQIKHINKLLIELKNPKSKSPDLNTKQSVAFDTLFKNDKDKLFTLDALEDLSLTREGKSILSTRKKSALRGFVEALKEENIIPNHNTDTLCELFAMQIAMPYKARLKATDTSNAAYKAMKKHIKEHY